VAASVVDRRHLSLRANETRVEGPPTPASRLKAHVSMCVAVAFWRKHDNGRSGPGRGASGASGRRSARPCRRRSQRRDPGVGRDRGRLTRRLAPARGGRSRARGGRGRLFAWCVFVLAATAALASPLVEDAATTTKLRRDRISITLPRAGTTRCSTPTQDTAHSIR
jgi:hypothetical protein